MMRSAGLREGHSQGSIMAGDLPPNSRITGVRFSAAEAITFLPVAPEPVKMMRSKASFGELDADATCLFNEDELVFWQVLGRQLP
jgi:hypothetical protein